MELPRRTEAQSDKTATFWHGANIIAFIILFLFSVLFSIIGYLTVERLTSIDRNMIDFVKEQKQQDIDIQILKDTKLDKPNIQSK